MSANNYSLYSPNLASFETELPVSLVQQSKDIFCGPACLQMLFKLENPQFGQAQDAIWNQSHEVHSPDDRAQENWHTSPYGIQQTTNRTKADGVDLKHYHIVHAESPVGPLCEVAAWLRDEQGKASFVLANEGYHWLLAFGAEAENGRLVSLSLANPRTGTGELLEEIGLLETFKRNSRGEHPDWNNRFVVVVPSDLPRRAPAVMQQAMQAHLEPEGQPLPFPLPVWQLNLLKVRIPLPQVHLSAPPPLTEDEKSALLSKIRDKAVGSKIPRIRRLRLAKVLRGEHSVHTTGSGYRLAQVCDVDGNVLADAWIDGATPALAGLSFSDQPQPGKPRWEPVSMIQRWEHNGQIMAEALPGDDVLDPALLNAALLNRRLVWFPCAEASSRFTPFLEVEKDQTRVWIAPDGTGRTGINVRTGGL